jgi:hypothetical protein
MLAYPQRRFHVLISLKRLPATSEELPLQRGYKQRKRLGREEFTTMLRTPFKINAIRLRQLALCLSLGLAVCSAAAVVWLWHKNATTGRTPTTTLNPGLYGAVGDGVTDDTRAIDLAIAAAPSGCLVKFNTGRTYVIGELAIISKPITLDFSNSYIKPATTGILFRIQQNAPDNNADRIIIQNATVIASGTTPANIVKILYGGINPTLHNFNIQGAKATHSFIWNYASYGLKISDCKIRNSFAPYALYCSHSNTDPYILTNAVDIEHVDLSNLSGIGIYFEGGIATIRGQSVVEGCLGGGIIHGNEAYANKIVVRDSYFEGNLKFDVSLGTSGGNYSILDSNFLSTGLTHHVLTSASTVLTAIGNTFYSGGISGDAPISYVGVNNIQRTPAPGYAGTFDSELADTLRGAIKAHIIKPTQRMVPTTIAAGDNLDLIARQPLSGTAYEEWRIVGTTNLAIGLQMIARVYVSCQDTKIAGVVVTDLQETEILTLDQAPGGNGWLAGNIIFGKSSGARSEIVEVVTNKTYRIKNRDRNFTLGEALTNGLNSVEQGLSHPTVVTPSGGPHSVITVEAHAHAYSINIQNFGPSPMTYFATRTDTVRRFP